MEEREWALGEKDEEDIQGYGEGQYYI